MRSGGEQTWPAMDLATQQKIQNSRPMVDPTTTVALPNPADTYTVGHEEMEVANVVGVVVVIGA